MLTYVFDKSEPEKRKVSMELVKGCWEGKRKFIVSVQNLSEFYVAVTEKVENPIPKEVAKKFVDSVVEFEGWRVINFDGHTVSSAVRISIEYGVPYWDALIAATMEENGIRCIYTEDEEDFKKIPWLEVVNPLMSK